MVHKMAEEVAMVVEEVYKHCIAEAVELGQVWLYMGLSQRMQYMDEDFVVEPENHRRKLQVLVG